MGNGLNGNWSDYSTVTARSSDYQPLIAGYKWTASTLYFSFPESDSTWDAAYSSYDEPSQLVPFTSTARGFVRTELSQLSRLVALTFTEVVDDASQAGDLRFTMTDTDGALGWAYYPHSSASGGDVWMHKDLFDPNYGDYDYTSILHELGHALGLEHPFENDADWKNSTYAPYHYSIMNYQAHGAGSYNIYPTSFSSLDIFALWELYGQNTTASAGDDTYTYDADGRYLEVLWDAGGIDTLVYDSQSGDSGTIDLTPDAWSTVGQQVRRNDIPIANLHILRDSNSATADLIENATGGMGNETLLGNNGANTLIGGAGTDVLNGRTGADRLDGGSGNDTYSVDNSGDTVIEATGSGADVVSASIAYTLPANVETLSLSGTAALNGTGNRYNNALTGNRGANLLKGQAGNDTLRGGVGRDTLSGGDGTDLFTYGTIKEGNDRITDFARGDKLAFLSSAFGKLATGSLSTTVFEVHKGGGASRRGVRFVFDPTSRTLSYDADGNASGVAVTIAVLNFSQLAAGDIRIVATI